MIGKVGQLVIQFSGREAVEVFDLQGSIGADIPVAVDHGVSGNESSSGRGSGSPTPRLDAATGTAPEPVTVAEDIGKAQPIGRGNRLAFLQ